MSHPGIPTGVHVLCEAAGRVLLMRRAGTGFFDGLYSLPGGHVEPGESVLHAAARELWEETGLQVAADALEWLGVVHRLSDTNRIDFFVRARKWVGEATLREPDKCDQLQWFERARLPAAMVPYVRTALEAGEGPWMRELGWTGVGRCS
ncbi:MAG: NUDIX domain-containing protein [Azoarcus sp.]|nr:NUDIX domain-containing protein [Azoarcus sp.]